MNWDTYHLLQNQRRNERYEHQWLEEQIIRSRYPDGSYESEYALVKLHHDLASEERIKEIILIRSVNGKLNDRKVSEKERNKLLLEAFKKYGAEGNLLTDTAKKDMKSYELLAKDLSNRASILAGLRPR